MPEDHLNKYQDTYILEGMGGEAVVHSIAFTFVKLLSQNSYLSQYFEDIDVSYSSPFVEAQKRYLLLVITSTPLPEILIQRIRKIHFKLGLDNSDFDKMKALYAEAFSKLKVQDVLIDICLDKLELHRGLIVQNIEKNTPEPAIEYESPLIDALGGPGGIEQIAQRVNELAQDDEILSEFFTNTLMDTQTKLLKKFLLLALNRGSITSKMKKHMRKSHSKMKLTNHHFDQMKKLYINAFNGMNLADDTTTTILRLIEETRSDIVWTEDTEIEDEIHALNLGNKPALMMGFARRKSSLMNNSGSDSDKISPNAQPPQSQENSNKSSVHTLRRRSTSDYESNSQKQGYFSKTTNLENKRFSILSKISGDTLSAEKAEEIIPGPEPGRTGNKRMARMKSWATTESKRNPSAHQEGEKKKERGLKGLIKSMSSKFQKNTDGTVKVGNAEQANNPSSSADTYATLSDKTNNLNRSNGILGEVSFKLMDLPAEKKSESILPIDPPKSIGEKEQILESDDKIDDAEELARIKAFKSTTGNYSRRNSTKEMASDKNLVEVELPKRRGSLIFRSKRSLISISKSGTDVLSSQHLPSNMTKSPSKSSLASLLSNRNKAGSILGRFSSIGSIYSSRSNVELDSIGMGSKAHSKSSISKHLDDYIYENLGGEDGVSQAIDKWAELVQTHPLLHSFFDKVDMNRLKAMQKRYIMLVTTQHKLPQRDMEILITSHAKLGLTDAHFDAIKEIYSAAFLSAGTQGLMVDLALDRIEKTRDMILGRYIFPDESLDTAEPLQQYSNRITTIVETSICGDPPDLSFLQNE